MPSPFVVRSFESDHTYHVYNRGVNKYDIFIDEADYKKFLYYLHVYLLTPERVKSLWPRTKPHLIKSNLSHEVSLLSYCLMPNHFHLLLHQKSIDSISKLIQRLTVAYCGYFNYRHDWTGSLMQGPFGAVPINSEESLLMTSRYIHLNPLRASLTTDVLRYRWSSIHEYANPQSSLCSTHHILSAYESPEEYIHFVSAAHPEDFSA